jgi:hypothetical protein
MCCDWNFNTCKVCGLYKMVVCSFKWGHSSGDSDLTWSCLFTQHTTFDSHFLDGGLDVEEQQNSLRDLPIVIHVIYFCGVGQHLVLLLVKTENNRWTDFEILSGCSSWLRNQKYWVAWILQAAGVCENACGLGDEIWRVVLHGHQNGSSVSFFVG